MKSTRTFAIAPSEKDDYNGLWTASIEFFFNDESVGTGTSAPLFENKASADSAAKRALSIVSETGVLPNMCKAF
jgi:hypothetical protein